MASGFISADNTFACHGVDYRNGLFIAFRGFGLVAGFDGNDDFLDESAKLRSLARVLSASAFGLASAFSGLSCVGQVYNSYNLLFWNTGKLNGVICVFLTGLSTPAGKKNWLVVCTQAR
jgi:hypothetical protein